MGNTGDFRILLGHTLGRIDDQNDHIGTLYGRYGTDDAVALQIFLDFALAADSQKSVSVSLKK